MSLIKPDRETLFEMVEQCLDSVYLCVCLCESSKINSLIPLAVKDAAEQITKFYDLCKYDYPDALDTIYSDMLKLENEVNRKTDHLVDFCISNIDRLEEIYDFLLEIHTKIVEEDNKCDCDLRHEEYCDLCHLMVDLYNATCLYKVFTVKTSWSDSTQREKRAFEMASTMKRERILPKGLHSLADDLDLDKAINTLKSYLLEKMKLLNTGCSRQAFDLFNFFIYLSEMEQILSFTFDDESELFRISFAPGWEKKGIEGLSLIENITFHSQADGNEILVNAWLDREDLNEQEQSQQPSTDRPVEKRLQLERPEYEDKLLYISVDLPVQIQKRIRKEPVKQPKKLTDGIFPILRLASAGEVETDDFRLQYNLMTDYGKIAINITNFGSGKELKKAVESAIDDMGKSYIGILNEEQYNALKELDGGSLLDENVKLLDENLSLLDELETVKKELKTIKEATDNLKNIPKSKADIPASEEYSKCGPKLVPNHSFEIVKPDMKITDKNAKGDAINPGYYKHAGLECIDAMSFYMNDEELYGYCKGCAFKYLWRAGNKSGNSAQQDYQKAAWYLEKAKQYE